MLYFWVFLLPGLLAACLAVSHLHCICAAIDLIAQIRNEMNWIKKGGAPEGVLRVSFILILYFA